MLFPVLTAMALFATPPALTDKGESNTDTVSISVRASDFSDSRDNSNETSENGHKNYGEKQLDYRGSALLQIKNFDKFDKTTDEKTDFVTLISPVISSPIEFDQAILSWNVESPGSTGIEVLMLIQSGEHQTKWYHMGKWAKENSLYPRESVKGQKDAHGSVDTDTLVLRESAKEFQLKIILKPDAKGELPNLKLLGVALHDSKAQFSLLEPLKTAWGKEIVVPGRPQSGYPGASGWCSPTSADMTLAFWASRLSRPELDLPVPDVAHSIFDTVYDGTGNWSFNVAFAGSFPKMRAYVSRFSDIRELEMWSDAGLPVVVSVSYDLLKGKLIDNDPGHLMVCDGFTGTGDIILNDPAHHPEKGEACRKIFPRANFIKGWKRSQNTVYLIYPAGTKLPANEFGHWE